MFYFISFNIHDDPNDSVSVICIYICLLPVWVVVVVQSVSITTKVVNLNSAHGEVYSIQHYVLMFVSDLPQVGGFPRFPPPITMTANNWNIVEVALNTINITPFFFRYCITTHTTISLRYIICNVHTNTSVRSFDAKRIF